MTLEPPEKPRRRKTAGPSNDVAPSGPAGCSLPVRSVKQVNALLQQTLAMHLPPAFLVRGELSNFRTYDRGHAFFTLKEQGAELACVMWRDALARLRFKPRDGMAVLAQGSIRLYEPQGKVQLYVDSLQVEGTGELELAFRQLCEKLSAEGLFAPERKKPLPRLPQRIVIVTSRTGDVLHDVLTTAYRRYPGLHSMLLPVAVQGQNAAPQIVAALEDINAYAEMIGGVDLILLVRGGGSLEDLWAFNEESVARAIAASRIPVATGIGHEPDTTIADLVGDLRGPTPTGVTEMTIPDVASLARELDAQAALLTRDIARTLTAAAAAVHTRRLELTDTLRTTLRIASQTTDNLAAKIVRIEPRHAIAQGWRRIEEAQRTLDAAARVRRQKASHTLHRLASRLDKSSPLLKLQRCADHVEKLETTLTLTLRARVEYLRQKLAAGGGRLEAVNPLGVLRRGYSITRNEAGELIRSKSQVRKGETITTHVADGEFKSMVGEARQGKLF